MIFKTEKIYLVWFDSYARIIFILAATTVFLFWVIVVQNPLKQQNGQESFILFPRN